MVMFASNCGRLGWGWLLQWFLPKMCASMNSWLVLIFWVFVFFPTLSHSQHTWTILQTFTGRAQNSQFKTLSRKVWTQKRMPKTCRFCCFMPKTLLQKTAKLSCKGWKRDYRTGKGTYKWLLESIVLIWVSKCIYSKCVVVFWYRAIPQCSDEQKQQRIMAGFPGFGRWNSQQIQL